MISEYKIREIRWLDVVAPSKEELRDLEERYNLSGKVTSNLLSDQNIQGLNIENDTVYILLPVPIKNDKSLTLENVLFIISNKHIVSFHNNDIHSLQKFTHSVSADRLVKTTDISNHPLNVFLAISDVIYGDINSLLENIEAKAIKIESQLSKGNERSIQNIFFTLNRDISTILPVLSYHSDLIKLFLQNSESTFSERVGGVNERMNLSLLRLTTKAKSIQSTISNLEHTSLSLRVIRLRKYLLKIALLGIVLMLGGILCSVLVNGTNNQFVDEKYGFYGSFILIGIGTIFVITALIKLRKWL